MPFWVIKSSRLDDFNRRKESFRKLKEMLGDGSTTSATNYERFRTLKYALEIYLELWKLQ